MTLEERVIEEGIHSVIHYAYNRNGWCIRKTEELQGNGPVRTAVTKYGYDAENLRFELLENGRKTSFVYHNGELLHEEGRENTEDHLKTSRNSDNNRLGEKADFAISLER